MLSHKDCVQAIVHTIIQAEQGETDIDRRTEFIAQFILVTQHRMPDYFRLALRVLTLIFDAWTLPISGSSFHRSSSAIRLKQFAAWRESRFQFRRSLITFYTNLTMFGLYSDIYEP